MTDQPNHNRSGDNASDRPRPTHEAAHEREPRSSRFSHRPEEQRDHSPYGRRKAPGFENENVHYLNVEALTRPLEIPTKVKRGMIVALAIATIVGAMMLFAYFDGVVNAPAREKEQMQQMLSEEIALELPDLASLAQLDDATIMSALQSAGGTYYEKNAHRHPASRRIRRHQASRRRHACRCRRHVLGRTRQAERLRCRAAA